MKKYIIGFDMDKVIADFEKRFKEKYSDKQQFPQADIRFFEELEPLKSNGKNNIDYMKELAMLGHDIRILTAPSIPNLGCWTGKAVWIKRYLGEEYLKKLIITHDKSMAAGNINILIDDSTCNGQLKFYDGFLHYGTEKYPDMQSCYEQIIEWSAEGKIFN